ncbi:GFA family protein [Sulfidibacter corallicola]|uniref:GFA family protein n=1 Tax=Sulfidibacter corallicola TaxID=2818388 RepID=A0A8A4TCN7_SULCO|nr:GFA family protein [Sulfidibacter corallicola]QTD47696.1 GFA family protein [Sulfidibacter corallicola]
MVPVWKEGTCHCGRIRFRVRAMFEKALECNCSICFQKGYIHLIVPSGDFELLQGQRDLSTYRFNTGEAKHHFCSHCGVSPFYVPRSHPDGYDVNLRCVTDLDWRKVEITPFDGANWEQNIQKIEGYES